jgi:hypothetical protein
MKIPTGHYYTEKQKKLTKESLNKLMSSQKVTPQLLGNLITTINASELDLAVPSLTPIKVAAGKYSAVDFQGVAWAAFKNLKKPGVVSLKIEAGLPAYVRGFTPGWPTASYKLDFTGTLAEDGYIDISFYIGGINFVGRYSELSIFEWDGKSYKNITTGVDLKRNVITGRTNKLTTYVIMNPEHGRKITGKLVRDHLN